MERSSEEKTNTNANFWQFQIIKLPLREENLNYIHLVTFYKHLPVKPFLKKYCRRACSSKNKRRLKLQIIFSSNFRFSLERCMTNTPLRQRLQCVSYFINKQNEFLELLSSYFRCLADSTNKDCVSSIARTLRAMKGKYKMQ